MAYIIPRAAIKNDENRRANQDSDHQPLPCRQQPVNQLMEVATPMQLP